MSDPTCNPADGKRGSEQIRGEAQPMQEQRCIKLDIGFEITLRVAFCKEPNSNIFYFPSQCIESHIARRLEHLLSSQRQHFRAWIARPVDTMTKPHQSFSAFEFLTHDRLCPAGLADLKHHIQRRSE